MSASPELEPDRPNQQQFDADPQIVTLAIRQWEDDVRALLNYVDRQYLDPEMSLVVRRLRLLVGD